MATDNSIQNQKVFVKLAAVLELQAHYHKILAYQGTATGDCENDCRVAERDLFEQIIHTLELPIQISESESRYSLVVRTEVPNV